MRIPIGYRKTKPFGVGRRRIIPTNPFMDTLRTRSPTGWALIRTTTYINPQRPRVYDQVPITEILLIGIRSRLAGRRSINQPVTQLPRLAASGARVGHHAIIVIRRTNRPNGCNCFRLLMHEMPPWPWPCRGPATTSPPDRNDGDHRHQFNQGKGHTFFALSRSSDFLKYSSHNFASYLVLPGPTENNLRPFMATTPRRNMPQVQLTTMIRNGRRS